MALFVIADLHLSFGCEKPMDIFPGWQDYSVRLESNWKKLVSNEDTVVISGDISWAMDLIAALKDLEFINALPGKKLVGKGNHDYWWQTMRKMENFVQQHNLSTINFLHNNAFKVGKYAVCGTRGWIFEAGEEADSKVAAREAGRLKMSLEAAKQLDNIEETIVFLHYPPLSQDNESPEILQVMQEYEIKRCFYGHLHGKNAISRAVGGEHSGVAYKLISADAINFTPYFIG